VLLQSDEPALAGAFAVVLMPGLAVVLSVLAFNFLATACATRLTRMPLALRQPRSDR